MNLPSKDQKNMPISKPQANPSLMLTNSSNDDEKQIDPNFISTENDYLQFSYFKMID